MGKEGGKLLDEAPEVHNRTEVEVPHQLTLTGLVSQEGVGEDACKAAAELESEDHGKAVEGLAVVAVVGRYATVKKRSCCAVRMWASCCSCQTCKATAAAVVAVEREQCQVLEAAVAFDGVRIMWLPVAGSWPSLRRALKGCCCVHFVT